MLPRLLLASLITLLCIGCNRDVSTQASGTAATEAELAGVLAELTQALRKFSAEKRQVPASLNELVAAGYLKNLPQPPPGKTFGIDAKKLQVVLR